jgi:hypothetical protein
VQTIYACFFASTVQTIHKQALVAFLSMLAFCAQLQSKTFYLTFVADFASQHPFYLTEGR